ncbi:hypothetical protein [Bartonella sp. LJL80]
MFYKSILFSSLGILAGCLTLNGNYRVTATDAAGNDLTSKINFYAQGSGIYSVRNGICAAHPKAIVHIYDADTGTELKSESPYRCR